MFIVGCAALSQLRSAPSSPCPHLRDGATDPIFPAACRTPLHPLDQLLTRQYDRAMPQRWTPTQRERSHFSRDLLFFITSLGLTIVWIIMMIQDSKAELPTPLFARFTDALIGIVLGTATVVLGLMIVARRRSGRALHTQSRRTMLGAPGESPAYLIDGDEGPDVPTGPNVPAEEQARHNERTRRTDWINAATWLALGSAVPLFIHAANQVLDQPLGEDDTLFLVTLLALGIAGLFAWDAWRARLHSLQVSSDRTTLTGQTGWPMSRQRSLRLDQLVHVRCSKHFSGRSSVTTHFHLRDAHGITAMVEAKSGVRGVLRAAIATQPGVHVSNLASRELAGMFTWWGPVVAFVELATIMMMAAVAASAALGMPL